MRVTMNMNHQVLKRLSAIQKTAMKQTADQLRTELISAGYLPFDEGTLQNIATEVDVAKANKGIVSIVHDIPYATRLYYNPQYNFDRTTNSNARGLWWDDWLVGSKKNRPIQLYGALYKRLSGGVVT